VAGWVKLHRKIIESDIYVMPPLYLRVFERLLLEANHQDKEIPYKHPGEKVATKKLIKRGERLTSIRQICEWVGWYERGVFKAPNTKTIKTILDWLEANEMIEICPRESNREGTHYRIINYALYQRKPNEEVITEEKLGNSKETVITPAQAGDAYNKAPVEVTQKKQSGNSQVTVTGSKQECIKNDLRMIKKDNVYILSEDERRFFDVLSQVEGYPLDRKKDLEMYQSLTERYPELSLVEAIEGWRIYKLDKPLKKSSNARSQINNAFRNYVEWGRYLKGGLGNGEHQRNAKQKGKYDDLILR